MRQLIRNFLSLSAVNALSLLLPLVLVPILIRVLGPEPYGRVALYTYVAQIVVTLVDFGFSISAVDSVSRRAKESAVRAAELLWALSVFRMALIFALAVLSIGAFFVASVSALSVDRALALGVLLNALALGLRPWWYFQGLEQAARLVPSEMLGKIANLLGVVWLIRSPGDYVLVPVIAGATSLFASGLQYRMALSGVRRPALAECWKLALGEARLALTILPSRFAILGYTVSAPVIVRSVGGEGAVALYNVAERIFQFARVPFDLAAGSIYTRMSRAYERVVIRSTIALTVSVALLTSGLLVWIAQPVGRFFIGAESPVPLTLYAALALPAVALHGVLGSPVLIVHGYRRAFAFSLYFALLLYVLLWGGLAQLGLLSLTACLVLMAWVEYSIAGYRLTVSLRRKLI